MKIKRFLFNVVMSLLIPTIIVLIFGIASGGRTLTVRMLYITLQQAIVPSILSMAVVGHLTLGMWDFSAGGVVIAASIIGGNLMKLTNTGVVGLIFFCLIIGIGLSTLTGFLNNKLRVPILVLTIGLIFIYETFPRIIFPAGVTIRDKYTVLASAPWNFVVLAVMGVLMHIIHNKTAYGHNIRAVGGSSTIAKTSGIKTEKVSLQNFMVAGIFLGIGAVLHVSESGQILNVSALDSSGLVFGALMGYFISHFLSRFCPMAIGLVIGNFTMKFLSNGFVALGLPATLQSITTGFFLLVLLAYSANQERFIRYKRDKARAKLLNASM